jgi:hypothetical protein
MTSIPLAEAEAAPDVRDLDASAVLDAVVSARRAADAQEARLLALAVHWVDLHPVTPEQPTASLPTQRAGGLASALGPGFFDRAPLAGVGTPAVAEYAVGARRRVEPVPRGGALVGVGGGGARLPR